MRTVALKKILIVMCLVVVPVLQVSAQDWKSILQGVASAVEDKASEKLAGKVETLMNRDSSLPAVVLSMSILLPLSILIV